MSWETSIKGFKSYLQIERSLSDNSVEAYCRDIRKLASYAISIEINELKITRENISDFLVQLKNDNISASFFIHFNDFFCFQKSFLFGKKKSFQGSS